MKLSNETQHQVRMEIARLRMFIALYSRWAIVSHYRRKREWLLVQVAKYDNRMRALTLALEFGGAQ